MVEIRKTHKIVYNYYRQFFYDEIHLSRHTKGVDYE